MAYRAYVGDGCTTVKVKVAEAGQTLDDDVARIAAVRSAQWSAGVHHPAIRIDANGAWTVDEAVVAIRELDGVSGGLEYVEQPCRTLEELAELRGRISVPIAADESIRTASDPIRAAQMSAADIVVVKVPPLVGVHLALEVVRAAGVPVVVSVRWIPPWVCLQGSRWLPRLTRCRLPVASARARYWLTTLWLCQFVPATAASPLVGLHRIQNDSRPRLTAWGRSGALGGSTGWRGHGRRAPESSLARGSADSRRNPAPFGGFGASVSQSHRMFHYLLFVSSDSTPDFPPGTGAPAIRALAAGYRSYRDLAGIPSRGPRFLARRRSEGAANCSGCTRVRG